MKRISAAIAGGNDDGTPCFVATPGYYLGLAKASIHGARFGQCSREAGG